MEVATNHFADTAPWTRAEKLLLVVLGGVVFLDTLDLSLVQVALPSIGSVAAPARGPLQWIVSAFVLGYGGFCCSGAGAPTFSGAGASARRGLVALIAASASLAPSPPTGRC